MYRSSIWLPPRKQRKVVGEQHWKEDLQYTHLDFKNSELCKYYRLFKAKVPLCYAHFHLLPQPHLPSQSLHGWALPLGAELYSHWCCWFCPSPSGLRVRQHGPCSPPPPKRTVWLCLNMSTTGHPVCQPSTFLFWADQSKAVSVGTSFLLSSGQSVC